MATGASAVGQPHQASSVNAREIRPRPSQVCSSPCCNSIGTSVPDAAIPTPTPMKIKPPAKPRREGGTCASTVGAARTIKAPPATPERNRQAKNQAKDTGHAQAKNAMLASSIIARRVNRVEVFDASERPKRAPARYPARFAAPR
ncbi:hypothetical protein D3C87_1458360 [compost metagenome]